MSSLAAASASRPNALVYRGPAACDGCPEAVAHLLRTSPSNFSVQFAGPKEDVDITRKSLSQVDVYAQPGGGDLAKTWPAMKPYNHAVRAFVRKGGRYLGFCSGAYLAGRPGFDLLPGKSDTDEESVQPGAQVTDESNTIIQVDWTFSTGPDAGKTEKRWMFLQDGATIQLENGAEDANSTNIKGRFSSNGDVAATLKAFRKGWVGVVGPHPEATKDWYTPYHLHNPDGISLDIGYDFVETTMQCKA